MDKKEKLRKKLIKKTKKQVREKYSGRDTHIIRAINAIEDIDSVFNLLFEDVREWYSVHFPELERLVKGNETYLKLIAGLGERKEFLEKNILKIYENKKQAKKISKAAKKSVGAELKEKDVLRIKRLASKAVDLKKQRNALASYLESEIKEQMPNFYKIAGPLLGARLLNEAGSMKKLALMPSSTVQVLGAEKALFRHLKSGAKPPKHGIIFQHPMLKKVKGGNRGKMARTLSNKLSIAAREDYFGEKNITKKLLKELNERAKKLS